MKFGLLLVTGAAVLAWLGSMRRSVPLGDGSSLGTVPAMFTLRTDVPDFGLRRGERFLVCPDDPIYLGDVVALKNRGEGVVLARYCDELIACVAGRVRRVGTAW